MSTTPPCAAQPELFDSTDWFDHHRAQAICATCPLIAACRDRLRQAQELTMYDGGPEGTWAGQLIGAPKSSQRLALEERMFSDVEARTAHAAWVRGERDHRAAIGERVYQRRIKRAKTKGEAA